ncbi:MAG: caspase family protein [Novosphingobium sp.]|nr:caspase family protein [Novosphingobium sp.]
MYRLFVLMVAVLGVALTTPAEARRSALIIGNSSYAHANFLPNPAADAQLVAQAARRAGFDDVTLVTDLSKDKFDQTLRDFRSRADGAEVAMIYYAGHGIESAGSNWVIPVDATLQESRDLRFEAIELDGLLETLQGSQLRIVVLDACRNNPFGSNWRSAVRSVPKGLTETEVEGALVIFAAAGGQVATDGAGSNSPFASALAQRLPEPGLSIHRLGSVVREDVVNATGGRQSPWTNMSIDGREFFLVEAPGAKPVAAPAGAPAGGQGLADAYAWKYADAQNTLEEYQDYLNRFPNGVFVKIAQQRVAALQRAGGASSRPVAPAPVKPAPVQTAPAVPAAPPASLAQSKPATSAPVSGTPAPAGPAPAALPTSGDPTSVGVVTANANTVTDRAPLPTMPATPRFPSEGYPDCREEFQTQPDPISKVVKINNCLTQLTSYFDGTLNGYSRTMIQHQEEISSLYTNRVAGNPQYSPQSQQRFYKDMMAEHAASNPTGANFAEFRAAKERYEVDRTYLQDRYCANTGSCGGYPVPPGVAGHKK